MPFSPVQPHWHPRGWDRIISKVSFVAPYVNDKGWGWFRGRDLLPNPREIMGLISGTEKEVPNSNTKKQDTLRTDRYELMHSFNKISAIVLSAHEPTQTSVKVPGHAIYP